MSEHGTLSCRLATTQALQPVLTMSLCCPQHGEELLARWGPSFERQAHIGNGTLVDGSELALALCQSLGECWAGYVGQKALVQRFVAIPEYRPYLQVQGVGTVDRFSFHASRKLIDLWHHQVHQQQGLILSFFDMDHQQHAPGMQFWVPQSNISLHEWCDRPAGRDVVCQPDAERQMFHVPEIS